MLLCGERNTILWAYLYASDIPEAGLAYVDFDFTGATRCISLSAMSECLFPTRNLRSPVGSNQTRSQLNIRPVLNLFTLHPCRGLGTILCGCRAHLFHSLRQLGLSVGMLVSGSDSQFTDQLSLDFLCSPGRHWTCSLCVHDP